MKISEAWEKRWHGGPKPTWRKAPKMLIRGAGSPIDRTLRVVTNRQVKKQRLVFS